MVGNDEDVTLKNSTSPADDSDSTTMTTTGAVHRRHKIADKQRSFDAEYMKSVGRPWDVDPFFRTTKNPVFKKVSHKSNTSTPHHHHDRRENVVEENCCDETLELLPADGGKEGRGRVRLAWTCVLCK